MVRGIIFEGFTSVWHCQKDQNNVRDQFGYYPSHVHFDEDSETLIVMLLETFKCRKLSLKRHLYQLHFLFVL